MSGFRVDRYGPGESATEFEPGDFILTHRRHLVSRMIRIAQKIRGRERKYSYWSHAAVIVDRDGSLVEAETHGVVRTNLSKYQEREYHLVRIGDSADQRDRAQVAAFAESLVGQPFGFLDLFSVGLSLLTGAKVNVSYESHLMCSALVARALERTSAIFGDEPAHMLPADLARYYGVEAPAA
ncbi:MAG TPA: YiiX/YebB-like N1pC/P60 family cysteine hydrolase [Candidatus Dormibacteraeota bacterium]|nr:YiiX/YebB-like N1pC/P60 family cysteine hydrolase [Candidatus Dormibacteraeota bacterium]